MNGRITGLAILASLVVSTGCVYVDATEGSGVAETRRQELSDFSELEVNGMFDLLTVEVCDCDSAAIIRGDDNLIDDVELDVSSGRLEVRADEHFITRAPLEIRLQTRELDEIEFNGVGTVSARGIFTESFEASNNGVGRLVLKGEVRDAELHNAGTGHTDASRLVATTVRVDNPGTGNVEVCATHSLDASLEGTGSIFYDCQPTDISTNNAGTGDILPR